MTIIEKQPLPIKFPTKLLTFSVILSLLCLVILSFFITESYRFLERTINRDMIVFHKAEQIIYYDEILTMSARLAANPSQDTEYWHKRYLENEKHLDNAINKIINSAAKLDYDVSPILQTDIANQKLIEMEYSAFVLSKKGNFNEARKILFSEEYQSNKQVYSDSIITVVKNIRQRLLDLLSNARQKVWYSKITTIICVVFMLIIWFYTICNIRDWHKATKKAFLDAIEKGQKLEKSKKELEGKNYELARFNFIVAHDLKESLRSIYAFSQLAEKESNNDSIKDYFTRIQNASSTMRTLIEDLLSYSKLDNNKPEQTEINLNELIEQLKKETLNELINKNKVQINYDELPNILSDITKINQIFINLITNAITYNRSDVPTVYINYKRDEKFVTIFFRDNGIGVEKEYHQSIFELFTRLHDKREYQGTGLGLSICKKAIESLDGNIWIEQSDKTGSSFAINLPSSVIPKV